MPFNLKMDANAYSSFNCDSDLSLWTLLLQTTHNKVVSYVSMTSLVMLVTSVVSSETKTGTFLQCLSVTYQWYALLYICSCKIYTSEQVYCTLLQSRGVVKMRSVCFESCMFVSHSKSSFCLSAEDGCFLDVLMGHLNGRLMCEWVCVRERE